MGNMTQDVGALNFRHALGRFATGITVVTSATPDGRLVGLTVSSFNSVSLSPQLVLWSLGLHSGCVGHFRTTPRYNINVLAADQAHVSQRFGRRLVAVDGESTDRFNGIDYTLDEYGVPRLDGCCAWFQCQNKSQYEEGDHLILVGQVEHFAAEGREPLVFHGGQYRELQPAAA